MDTWLHPSPPIKTKNGKTGAHNRQSRNSPQPSPFTFLMVRSLILRIGYFFCVLCKSTTYQLIIYHQVACQSKVRERKGELFFSSPPPPRPYPTAQSRVRLPLEMVAVVKDGSSCRRFFFRARTS